jgi:hypothetical protein
MQTYQKKHSTGFWAAMISLGIVGILVLGFVTLFSITILTMPKSSDAPQQPQATTQPSTTSQVTQPKVLGKESDFTAKYGQPSHIDTREEMTSSGIATFCDRAVFYTANGGLLVASKGGVVIAVCGETSIDYKQYFPVSITEKPYSSAGGMERYYVTPSNDTGTIGELAVVHDTKGWAVMYTAYPAQ